MAEHTIPLRDGADLDGFRAAARRLAAAGLAPEAVAWSTTAEPGLFGACPEAGAAPPLRLPRAVGDLVRLVVCHREPERYALLYALIWRILRGERHLLEVTSDPLVNRLDLIAKAVRRDLHRMHAFLRFRRADDPQERFVAWFEPEHHILEAAAPFFVERFGALAWSILTPEGSAYWDRERLTFGPPGRREDAPAEDSFEAGWAGYYESTFNPARTNPDLMRQHMPRRYWPNLPEAASIRRLVQAAPERVREMHEREPTMPVKRTPARALEVMADAAPASLEELNALIRRSEPLVPGATQAVLGEGPLGASIAFVGEQPGDQEDLAGRPFVGPAGQLLTRAMGEVGIDRAGVYVTNAVKHFKYELRGKRRIHQKPTTGEVKHYRWWLVKELELVRPGLIVALGATAALALTGKAVPITRSRGRARFELEPGCAFDGYITVHPSYLLRLPDAETKAHAYDGFLEDLARVRDLAPPQVAA